MDKGPARQRFRVSGSVRVQGSGFEGLRVWCPLEEAAHRTLYNSALSPNLRKAKPRAGSLHPHTNP